MRARLALVAAVSMSLLIAACGSSSSASSAPTSTPSRVSNIASSSIRQADVPSEYSPLKFKIYRHFARTLTVGASGSSSGSTTCTLPSAVPRASFRQGLVLVLQNKRFSGFLECSYALSDILSARILYASFKQGFRQQNIFKLVARAPKVGDESSTISTSKSTGIAGYGVIFRHANAVISIAFVSFGNPNVTLSTVEHLASTLNTRLK